MQQVAKRVTSVREIRVHRALRAARRDQRGASLLEAIAYLGIAAIVVIGAVALLNGAFSSAGTNELAEQVNAIQSGVKKLYMGQSNGYTGVTTSTLAAAGVFPSTVPVNSTTGDVTNNWGGAVLIGSPSQGTFSISYANVPKAVCINAVSAGGSWTGISVGGGTALTVPVSPADAQTACATDSNTIVWTSN
jgi:X-X-X-Leu-X-X-Gly heptad repeat protein